MSAPLVLAPNSNTLCYHHSNSFINQKTLLFSKSFNSKFTSFSSQYNDNNNPIKNEEQCNLEFENQDYGSSSSGIKGPTAPWMRGPLLLEPNQVLDLSKSRKKKDANFAKTQNPNDTLSGKVSGGRGKKAMKMIYQGIDKLRETQIGEGTQVETDAKVEFQFPPGSLSEWGDVTYEIEEKNPYGEEDNVESLEGVEFGVLSREGEGRGSRKSGVKMPWESEVKIVYRRMKNEKVVTTAESNLDAMLLERLRGEAARIQKWVKVKKAGVTRTVVDQIHFIWKNNELAMLKFDLPLCRNMDRAREIVEMKTGGFVVWMKQNALVVYRGCSYTLQQRELQHDFLCNHQNSSFTENIKETSIFSPLNSSGSSEDEMISVGNSEEDSLAMNESLYVREANRLLDDLGPRYVDWWWPKPLPVDADLLPEVVPGFKPPFRLCPPRSRSKLTDDELTQLRKLARSLPTHFVLGRNRKLQGLAAAVVKLWEKCHIAKIALKWGIPNTSNELMANELKHLTGGVLLLRNKFFIILYRGKDFLPSQVANIVAEREVELTRCQLEEEVARFKAIETLSITMEVSMSSSSVGTLSEFQTIAEPGKEKSEVEVQLMSEKERLEKELRNQQHSLYILKKKIEKSSIALGKLNAAWRPAKEDDDKEILTQEERRSLRQIGLKMNRSLVLGRRGVFDGVLAGLHQHWKHREVIKVITMQKIFSQVIHTAKLLETESGGILISVDKIKEGHAMIIYRGKNYRRPESVPQNLLNKRQALCRSLEMQRLGSLKFYANQTEQAISDLKLKLVEYTVKIGQMGEI
ncbi:chloroplastic group IIA intron splicing facilitator CRS1, chloroplastic isoform X1 [Solanum stenotomum]|uniref:chloroplastic group IIA intron splicing facilitator CRS1, chloroplastic isoform X1 n=1 Tax=Solanum stenotomum TaxID=172797 RepID=UPI0020D02499|nr:chloroplastic group IIA intron splicing facilitator CRS1, chloroplastic isoform X1 [Solanum stenotomum]XP_049384305.1 chloroplastic group IIA intron splicing facilitator CRS1, chloroplastic isoform X1 [Solanum stenotomum]XP_049384306.1 chloroplastic group IIA intron splicing facilitator CRS1, chloroplastic isoform X1 [Solanum stenotomum]